MTANKMPEMPEAAIHAAPGVANAYAYGYHADQMRDYGRACYLAGLEAARQAVPTKDESGNGDEWNACRDQVLANLTALEQEAKR